MISARSGTFSICFQAESITGGRGSLQPSEGVTGVMIQSMRAVYISSHGRLEALCPGDVERPSPQKGEVLVKVVIAGVNRVDLVTRQGYPGYNDPAASYTRLEILPALSRNSARELAVRIGTPVLVYPLIGCGSCTACLDGRPNICLNWKFIGLHLDGGYAEYVLRPGRKRCSAHNFLRGRDGSPGGGADRLSRPQNRGRT